MNMAVLEIKLEDGDTICRGSSWGRERIKSHHEGVGNKVGTAGDAESKLVGYRVGGNGLSGGAHHVVQEETAESGANADGLKLIRIEGEILVQSHEDIIAQEWPDVVGDPASQKKFSKVLEEM